MKILVANPGSTSYKCSLYETDGEQILFQATVERIGDQTGHYSYKSGEAEAVSTDLAIPDYPAAVKLTLDSLTNLAPISEIAAVGFKTVHAKGITGCVLIDDKVIKGLEDYLPLAPVHNDVYLQAIKVLSSLLPDTPMAGLFETSFHSQIPPEAYLYGVPYAWYEKYGLRKYGFHGASHRYISQAAISAFLPDKQETRLISCHLGGSSSVCAVKNGISLDTSMGMSPQSGLINAKRTGDLDPYGLLYIMEEEGLSISETREVLGSQSGVLGISGVSGDFRDIEEEMAKGNKRAELAFKAFAYSVKRYIGEYLAVLNGADIIVFTGGLGQKSAAVRQAILSGMDNLGIVLDPQANDATTGQGLISTDDSAVKLAVMPTNEELIVAREIVSLLGS
jgi:acetate kinase